MCAGRFHISVSILELWDAVNLSINSLVLESLNFKPFFFFFLDRINAVFLLEFILPHY